MTARRGKKKKSDRGYWLGKGWEISTEERGGERRTKLFFCGFFFFLSCCFSTGTKKKMFLSFFLVTRDWSRQSLSLFYKWPPREKARNLGQKQPVETRPLASPPRKLLETNKEKCLQWENVMLILAPRVMGVSGSVREL